MGFQSSLSKTMSVASTRISLQWPPAPASEDSDVLVLVSNQAHFVDLRIKKDKSLSNPIDWIITGKEYAIPDTNKIEFQHEINTHVPSYHGGDYDVGIFNELENGDREELGEMTNLETGKIQPYRELWKSVDPVKSTPDDLIKGDSTAEVPCVVYKVKNDDEYLGTIVRLGNFLQGALLNKTTEKYSLKRVFLQNDEWETVFEYGDEKLKIPVKLDEKLIKLENIEWEQIESNI